MPSDSIPPDDEKSKSDELDEAMDNIDDGKIRPFGTASSFGKKFGASYVGRRIVTGLDLVYTPWGQRPAIILDGTHYIVITARIKSMLVSQLGKDHGLWAGEEVDISVEPNTGRHKWRWKIESCNQVKKYPF